MVWYARVQGFLDGDARKLQKHYIDLWKHFSPEEKQTFRNLVASKSDKKSKLHTEGIEIAESIQKPWHTWSGDLRTISLPANYSVQDLRRDFGQFADAPGSHDQSRWEMYVLILLLMRRPGSNIANATAAEKALADLHVNRKRLYHMSKNYVEPFPADCPAEFRMGRTPEKSLSHQEKEDLLIFVKVNERSGTALSVEQIQQAIAPRHVFNFFPAPLTSSNGLFA